MKSFQNSKYLVLQATFFLFLLLNFTSCEQDQTDTISHGPDKAPGSWMYSQRAFPHGINKDAKKLALQQHNSMAQLAQRSFNKEWEQVGPINIGGRMTDISLHPTNKNIIYAGSSVGGVWKSIDRGFEWALIFEEAGGASIGNIAISDSDPNTIYVGTGEANGSATSGAFFGNGMYKSTDAGETWESIGLPSSEHIGRILVHPENSDIVYTAVAGKLYDKNPERGLYKTMNGGESWDQVLFISDSTSVIDISLNSDEPDVIFAATWERTRFASGRIYGGVTSGLHKSMDGGLTWELLTNGLPQPNAETGRIGVMVSPSDPNRVYASFTSDKITNRFDAIYTSFDQGDSWLELNGQELSNVYSSFGWFFGNVRVHPTNPDEVYVLGVNSFRTTDGGDTWNQWASVLHADQHGMEFHQTDPDFIVMANDGGIYITEDAGETFRHVETIANNQFGGIRRRTNLTSIQSDFIKPDQSFGERYNWNTPFVTVPNEENGILLGNEFLLYSPNAGDDWEIISPDLTNGPYGDITSFGTISAIAISEIDQDIIVVGTDDGNVQITTNRGSDWTVVSDDLPLLTVSSVATDPFDAATIYVTFSGYRFNNYLPHVLRSTDLGETWEDIGSNLPESPINEIVLDPSFPDQYFIASDESVYYTANGGDLWEILGEDLPLTVYNDLDLHDGNRELLAATFGRSMLSFDLTSEQSSTSTNVLDNSIKVYPNPASHFINVELTDNTKINEIIILDISGRLVKNVSASERNIDVTALQIGNYILRISTTEGVVSKKFSKT